MDGSFGRHISSPLFTFQIGGDEGKEEDFIVHSGPIADLSPALHALLLNPEFKEAESRKVKWPDVNKDTFVRLCEFAYMQDYTPPVFREKIDFTDTTKDSEPVSRPGKENDPKYDPEDGPQNVPEEPTEDIPESVIIPEFAPTEETIYDLGPVPREGIADRWDREPQENHKFWDGWASWSTHQRRRKERDAIMRGIPPRVSLKTNSVRKLPIRGGFISDSQAVFTRLNYTPTKDSHQFDPMGNEGSTQDFTVVFLGHAELYVIADKYGIEPLRHLVLYKLHQTLKSFTVYETDVASILKFVRFTYQNTLSSRVKVDMLRNLATRYIVSIFGQIGDTEEFERFLAEGEDFVVDFCRIIRGTN